MLDTKEQRAAVPRMPSSRAIGSARIALLVTVLGWLTFLVSTVRSAFWSNEFSIRYALHALLYIAVVTVLAASAAAYLLARLGYLYRSRRHHRVPRATLDSFFERSTPAVTVLVPSYREEPAVIRQTVL